ncbi:hypothetical protein CROQUDRAFT_654482 [Cronartium quercuum f. sp. fusiforme G11]|uniref:Uncharacterized protein n=1 Tax=Cronartium quercuum f. sp. fusiforme G11 TaxID=708437 RepID=A0A9P6NQZ8_9BASI|nr:hypothetical protein CROQUDRAFT_654482 [Cronartium quercuum f. sp. fusiforme G11]
MQSHMLRLAASIFSHALPPHKNLRAFAIRISAMNGSFLHPTKNCHTGISEIWSTARPLAFNPIGKKKQTFI